MRAHSFLIHLSLVCCAYGSGLNLFSAIPPPLPFGLGRIAPPFLLQPAPPPLPLYPQPIFLPPAPSAFQPFPVFPPPAFQPFPLFPPPAFPPLPFPLPPPPGPPVVVPPKTAAILSIASLINLLITRKFFRYPTIRKVPVIIPVPVPVPVDQPFNDFTSIPILKKYRRIPPHPPPSSFSNEIEEPEWEPKVIPLNKPTTISEDHSRPLLFLEDDNKSLEPANIDRF